MKFICALLCCLVTEYLSADILDMVANEVQNWKNSSEMTTRSAVHRALEVKNVIKEVSNNETRNNGKRSQQKYPIAKAQKADASKAVSKSSKNILSRDALFADNSIKRMYLSSNAKKFAYVAKDTATKLDSIHILPIQNKGTFGTVVNDGVSVLEMAFVGDDEIVYTYADDNQNIRLKSVDLLNGHRRDITPVNGAHGMHIYSGQDGIITICNDGKQYFTHKIDVSTGRTELLKQAQMPMIALFDEKLVPTLVYKNIHGLKADVYVNTVIINGSIGEKYIDSIDMSSEKYVSVTATNCYKLQQKGNKVYLCSRLLSNGQEKKLPISEAESIRDCSVHLNKEGRVVFVSVKRGRIHHIVCNQSVKSQIGILSDKFKNSDWEKVGESRDGKIWMIRVQNPKKPTEYYLFSTVTGHFKFLMSSNSAANNLALRNTRCISIKTSNRRSLIGYLTTGKDITKASPLVVCVNSDAEHRYSWAYNPLAQLLADRGISVLCVDCHADAMYDDIIAVVKWCTDNKLATAGNIYLSAKKSACEPAAKLFLDRLNLFAGCVLLSSDIWDKLSAFSHMIKKPMLLIDDMEEGDFKHLNVDDALPVTYIGYTVRLRDSLSAALLEKFFALNSKLFYVDISARDSDSLMVLIDGCDLVQQKQYPLKKRTLEKSTTVYDML